MRQSRERHMTSEPLRVLIVDDQPAVQKALAILLDIHGIPLVTATTPNEACHIARSQTLGAVIQDMNFSPSETSGKEGVELFYALRAIDGQLPILLITAWASVEAAVELIKGGASDYIEKPWNDDRLLASLKNLLRLRALEVENAELRRTARAARETLAKQHDLCGTVYESPEMHRVVQLAVNVADSDAPVLITGPSGSGKERLAEIIQANSPRRKGPFVRVNVGAIPEELIESELFGAEAGAYTGLQKQRIGYFETADKGTLFLDEIDGLSLSGQVKLLRVVQTGELLRLGSSQTRRVDVRILSATNTDLRQAIREGRFREDLFFRLNVVELSIAALEQRSEDVLLLARRFLQQHASGEPAKDLSRSAERALIEHSWPGNVRELQNRVQRALLVCQSDEIQPEDLDLRAGEWLQSNAAPPLQLDQQELAERREILTTLAQSRGVVTHAAEKLGVSRQTLYRKMERFGIELERKAKSGPR
jgi:DNA-binding NtrC family response regulator